MPDWQTEVRKRLAGSGLDPLRENEIAEEIVQHLEERHVELTSGGREPGEAEVSVLGELDSGDGLAAHLQTILKPVAREPVTAGAPGRALIADLWQDLRYAAKALMKSRAFTIVTLLSLALGIGANTALFEFLVALHLRALPVHAPEELALVKIRSERWASGSPVGHQGGHADLSYPLWERIRDQQQVFSGALAWGEHLYNTATSGETRWASGLLVSGDYFGVLGVEPMMGRFFSAADDRRGCVDPGAILTHAYWQSEFGGDPSAVGRTISLEGHAVHVIGVLPASFGGLEIGRTVDVVLPLCMESPSRLDSLDEFWLSVVGRLRPGISLESASAQLATLSSPIFEDTVAPTFWPENAEAYRHFQLTAYPASTGISFLRQRYTAPLALLMGIAGLVLLMACTNLANLLLARANSREREIAVRLALGASRGRLVRQLMVESLLLASLGAALGLALAGFLGDGLMRYLDARVELRADWRVVGFSAALAALTALLFGLMPALRAARTDIGLVLKAGRSSTADRRRFHLRRVLVAAQVAFSFVLLLSAALFVRSLRNVLSVEMGFREKGVFTVEVDMTRDVDDQHRDQLAREIVDRLNQSPGVQAVAQTTVVPMSNWAWNEVVWLDGSDRSQKIDCFFSHVGADYFKVLGMNLLAGRTFTRADGPDSPKVAIVNEQFARRLAGGVNVVGRRLRIEIGDAGGEIHEIVGIVRDSKYRNLREDFAPIVFLPTGQDARASTIADRHLVLRSDLPMTAVAEEVKRSLAEVAPGATTKIDELQTNVRATTLTERLMATLAGFFGILASVLAAVGLYGIVSYGVSSRTREIGIRVALGADRRRVSGMVLRETGELLAAGLAAGILLGLIATRTAGTLLYGLAPHDPLTIVMAAALMAIVALVASIVPARRAASVDPMVAFREE